MRFRNLKTGTIEEPRNKDVEQMMLDCPEAYERIESKAKKKAK